MGNFEGAMSSRTKIVILHDIVAGKNELIKLLQLTTENLKAKDMDSSTLKPSDTHRNLHTRNGNVSELNIEETVVTTPRLQKNDRVRQINKTHIQLN